MNAFAKIDMTEVTRLTREGRLQEAMAMLHGALPSAAPPDMDGDAPPSPRGARRPSST